MQTTRHSDEGQNLVAQIPQCGGSVVIGQKLTRHAGLACSDPQKRRRNSASRTHPIFVYGTLKRGHMYHNVLRGAEPTPSHAPRYDLHQGPGYPIACKGSGSILGELYYVSGKVLVEIDELEQCPELFQRSVTQVILENGSTIDTWIYTSECAFKYPKIENGIWSTEYEWEEEV